MTPELIQAIAPAALDLLIPVILSALGWIAGVIMVELRKRFQNDNAHRLLDRLERAAGLAVGEINQTIVPAVREALTDDGKISKAEAERLRTLALSRIMALMGTKGAKALRDEHGDELTRVVGTVVESQVRAAKSLPAGKITK